MPRARIVVDTNVLISAALLPESTAARTVRRIVAEAQLLVSEATLTELAGVLTRSKFDAYISAEERQGYFERLARIAELVAITTTIRACRDSKDDKFLELAVSGQARFIVTGDQDLLVLTPYGACAIVTPAQMLAMPASALVKAPDDSITEG